VDVSGVLSDADWSLLLRGATSTSFPPGTVLIEEGDKPHQLFQIVKGLFLSLCVKIVTTITGVCSVQKSLPTGKTVVAHRTIGDIFGEVSFLDSEDSVVGASASVVADTSVEVCILKTPKCNNYDKNNRLTYQPTATTNTNQYFEIFCFDFEKIF
jgi:CRP-like cAMP-binding protein